MIAYTTLGTNDMDKAKAFYTSLFAEIGARVLLDMGRLATIGTAMNQPMLAVCRPFNKEPASAGNGTMVAFNAGGRDKVESLYAKALSLGASCEGQPSERMPSFYAAYVRDPDGHKLAFIHMGYTTKSRLKGGFFLRSSTDSVPWRHQLTGDARHPIPRHQASCHRQALVHQPRDDHALVLH